MKLVSLIVVALLTTSVQAQTKQAPTPPQAPPTRAEFDDLTKRIEALEKGRIVGAKVVEPKAVAPAPKAAAPKAAAPAQAPAQCVERRRSDGRGGVVVELVPVQGASAPAAGFHTLQSAPASGGCAGGSCGAVQRAQPAQRGLFFRR